MDPDFVMVTTRTGNTYFAAPSSKPRPKNVRFVGTQLQPGTCDPPTELVSDHFSVNSNSSMYLPQDSASLVHDRCPLAALIGQEPVQPCLEENGDSRQTLHVGLPGEVQITEPTPLQETQSTEPGSQESDTGLAESEPGEHPDTVTPPCEDMHAGLISEEIITAGAAPQEEGPTNCDPRDIQPELFDLAFRELVGCYSPQETNSVSLARCETGTEIEIVDLTGCQEPEAASLAPHETARQVRETADCIRPQGPEIANPAADETADAGHCDIANLNPLTIADPPPQSSQLPKSNLPRLNPLILTLLRLRPPTLPKNLVLPTSTITRSLKSFLPR
ncbi:hypothetical protein K469DRAFT_682229 [Zopfia rhizophila CBS 207.26]|uniref:Uncharacterized protein n=1 Tax=Zopfia rhizophila CBS 207.26 TaxID=1314779 RepID=A0A6A6EHJ3_9PEZI|nr:hypothetical protein K469DRAFT_682229 [Zopfia rhizophila CBS 207.26]